MSGALVKYDAACRALAAASRVDEVKAIRDEAIARKLYAKMAKNKKLETDAAVIRDRATKKLGDLMKAQSKAVGTARGRRSDLGSKKPQVFDKVTLTEAGIDKNLAKKARLFSAIPEEVFEQAMAEARRESVPPTMKLINALADAAVDAADEGKPKTKNKPWPKPSPLYDPWSKLSHAVRSIADQDAAQFQALAQQARRVGFLDVDLKHARIAIDLLSHWHTALIWEAAHGTEAAQRRNTEPDREGAQASVE